MKKPPIIIGVPGKWQNLAELGEQIPKTGAGYVFAGRYLRSVSSGATFEIELYDFDPNLRVAFEIAGEGRLSRTLLNAIDRHRHTAYLIGSGGSVERGWEAVSAVVPILGAGGIAVKVETTGKAHAADEWRTFSEEGMIAHLYSAMVVIVTGTGSFFSCGMHNLGLPDAMLPKGLGRLAAERHIKAFNLYVLREMPTLEAGQTFQSGPGEPVFTLAFGPDSVYAPDDYFHNPYGVWRLVKAASA